MKTHAILTALAAVLLLAPRISAVEIVAHRGASHDAPENTLASFKLGWEQQTDADELDIYLTKDGKIAVMHDANTKRTTGVDSKVADSTMEELRALDAGAWKGEQWKGEKIPSLDEVLKTIPDGKQLFIEIKCGPEVIPELERVLKASGKKPEQLVIIGFKYEIMREAKARFPQLRVYWIVSPKKDSDGLVPPIEELVASAKAAGLDGLDLNEHFAFDEKFVARVKDAGLKLYVWTVDNAADARKLARLGVDGLTTNRPAWLREQLAAKLP